MADPALYSMRDLDTWVTIDHVLDAHEALDLRAAQAERAARDAERN